MTSRFLGKTAYKIIGLLAFVALTSLFICLFSNSVTNNATQQSIAQLGEVNTQISNTIKIKMEASLACLKCLSNTFADYRENLHSAASLALLEKVGRDSMFSRIWLVTPDGAAMCRDDVAIDVAELQFFIKAIGGESGYSEMFSSGYNGDRVFTVYAPLQTDESIFGAIFGSYNEQYLLTTLNIQSFDNKGSCYIFKGNGDIVAAFQRESNPIDGSNLFDFLNGAEVSSSADYSSFFSSVSNGSDGNLSFSVDGDKHYGSFSPLGVNGWFTLTVIPESVVATQIKPVISIGYALIINITIICAAIIITVILIGYRSKKIVADAYQELSFLNHHLPGGVRKATADSFGKVLYVSDGFLKLMEYTKDDARDILNHSFLDTAYEPDRENVAKAFASFNGEGILRIRYRIVTKTGKTVWISERCSLINNRGIKYYHSIIVDITEAKNAEDQLRMAYEQYKIAVSQINHILFEYFPDTNLVVHADDKVGRFGISKILQNVPDSLIKSGVIHPDSAAAFLAIYKTIKDGGASATCEVLVKLASGRYEWERISLTSIYNDCGKVAKAVGIIQNISKEKETELRLREEKKYRASIIAETIFTFDFDAESGTIATIYNNNSLSEGFMPLDKYFYADKAADFFHPDDSEYFYGHFSPECLKELLSGDKSELRLQHRIKDASGCWKWVETIVRVSVNTFSGHCLIVYVKNIDERKRKELALVSRAEHDPLTGLYNRAAAVERVNTVFESRSSVNELHAFIVIDLDHFKEINDTYGHISGDKYLCAAAQMLTAEFRQSDIASRLGGDEFIVFLRDIRSYETALIKARAINDAIRKIPVEDNKSEFSSVSIGVSLSPRDGRSFSELYKKADAALYRAKEAGRDTFAIYNNCDD